MNRQNARRTQIGVSLIESLMVLVVIAVTLGATLPSFGEARQRRHLDGAAAQLETDIQYARSEAVAANRTMRLSFLVDNHGSCYVIHTGAANTCGCSTDGTAVCGSGDHAVRSVRFNSQDAVQLSANVSSIVFDPLKGTSTPTGTLRLVGRDDRSIHLVVNLMGRVRACSPVGAVPGYRPC